MSKLVSQDDFVKRSKEAHGDRYDYSEAVYIKSSAKVTIICKEHGPFLQAPNKHWVGRGCPKCKGSSIASKLRGDVSSVLAQCAEAHGNIYDYSKVEYTNLDSKVTIVCPEHGDFQQTLANHRKGKGCPKCGRYRSSSSRLSQISDVIAQLRNVHGSKYQYPDFNYEGCEQLLKIVCPEHGVFEQKTCLHLRGCGCPSCGREVQRCGQMHTKEDFIKIAKLVHGDLYDYSESVYEGDAKKITILCKKHGPFTQLATNHKQGSGCPSCKNKISKAEKQIFDMVKEHVSLVLQSDRTILKGKELDIYIPEKKLAIEFNGVYFHQEDKRGKNYHLDKYLACKELGIRLIQISDYDWNKRRVQMEQIILNALGVTEKEKINARDCKVVKFSASECKEFFDTNHPQGHASNPENYALVDKAGRCVAIMSFGFGKTSRGNASPKGCWELSRYATCGSVRGGASRLYKAFVKEHDPLEVRSFSMNDWFTGDVYKVLGFTGEHIPPDYRVYHPRCGLKSKSHWQRREIPKRLREIASDINFIPEEDTRSQTEIENLVGAIRLWDSGKIRWTWLKDCN